MMEKLQKLAPLKKTLVKGIGHNAFFQKMDNCRYKDNESK